MFLPFSAEATPPVCREDVPGLLWINTLGGFFLSRLLSARNLRAKVQQKNDMCKEMPYFLITFPKNTTGGKGQKKET